MNVLIVDDNPMLRRLLEMQVSLAGYEVIQAEDGLAAWEIIQQGTTPLVITDWMMPRMDGIQLVQHIRAANLPFYTYIILLTARNELDDVVMGLDAGADDYLVKPLNARELRARLSIGERILTLETRLRHLATYDPLTGLLNRRALYERTEAAFTRSMLHNRPFSIVLLDIDYFKYINDTHGHQEGDRALALVADTLRHSMRPDDLVGRWGGEEFLIALPDTPPAVASAVAERLCLNVARAAYLHLPIDSVLHPHASLGVTTSTLATDTLDHLVSQADWALYAAKRAGRNQVQFFDPSLSYEQGDIAHEPG